MPLPLALDLVRQAGKMPNFSCVGFTGGEAMLFFDDLLTIGDACLENQLPMTIATACHWAGTLEIATSKLRALKARGLVRLNISHDPSHAEFVTRDHAINAAVAASALAIPTYIVGTFYESDVDLAGYIPEVAGLPYVKLVSKYVAKVGRAARKDITQATYGISLGLDDLACYRQVHHDLVVFWDGAVYPCCSTFNRATRGIAIGNARQDSLAELWRRAEGSLMFRVMKRQGFGRLYEIVREVDPELYAVLPSVDASVGPCSLCNKLFKGDLSDRVKAVFATYEVSQARVLLERLEEEMEPVAAAAFFSDIAELVGFKPAKIPIPNEQEPR